jgi:hypothetical protein
VPVDEFVAASLIYRDVALAMLGGSWSADRLSSEQN